MKKIKIDIQSIDIFDVVYGQDNYTCVYQPIHHLWSVYIWEDFKPYVIYICDNRIDCINHIKGLKNGLIEIDD